ncbi:hypothetical protein ACFFSW_32840 [Saccharothrix longispora]|uniref:Secreted protein n=1 Tax=Saccharothrix longispora TaxID=33920 RepID=A0ABU1Q226_9PSEU|nr:hypothetical protein [Saccharothrix longispora]MDR6596936.1 hypothetical protein [Saccharothrix longispora]
MGRSALWGLLIGTVLMSVLFLFGFAIPTSVGESGASVAASLVASGILGVVMGGVPGTLIGLVVGAVRRPRQALPPPRPPQLLPPAPPPPNDRWSAMVARCELSVSRVRAAVNTIPPSPARQWFERIAAQFDGELADVRRMAHLGRALDGGQDHPVARRLAAAVRDFTAFEDEVGRVALRMFDQPSLEEARVHLEVLEQQLPNLGNG